jgi:anti-sigma factor RsiW
MQCKQADSLIDAYMDGEMVGERSSALRLHAESCDDCRARIGEERVLRARLAALPIEDPADGFFVQALRAAKVAQPDELTDTRAKPRRQWAIRSGGALAAGFTLWFAAGYLLHAPVITSSPALPEVVISMSQPTSVNLVFTSTGDLTGARVSLQLPTGIELAGYDGRRELTWTTDLKDGKNVLRLPLIAHAVPAEEIVARLEHGDETKTFRLKVRVKPTTQGTVL